MIDLYEPEAWGWKPEFHAAWAATNDTGRPGLSPARVVGRERGLYELVAPDFSGRPGLPDTRAGAGLLPGVGLAGAFARNAEDGFPAIGDWVTVDAEGGAPRIRGVLRRRSALRRGRAGKTSEGQLLAANVDTLLIVFALDGGRNFLVRFLERALVAARSSGAAACVVLNKADLCDREDRERAEAEAGRAAPGAPVVALSARTGKGVDELRGLLSPGETVSMLGKSGVGKSALVNALGSPTLSAEGEVREGDLRGRHTTTSSRLYRLESGVLLIDGPGIRELKLWGDGDDLDGAFPEIAGLAERCRFSDCSHSGEPGCAVADALATGELEPERYAAYLALAKELAYAETRRDEKARREHEAKWKDIAKLRKELKLARR